VETGDGFNEDNGGLLPNEENVIRLPRDWLGPPEELVPIGPAARARAAQRDLDDGIPPAADAFWSEDSAALHDAVQAPLADVRDRVAPPVGLLPPVAGLCRARAVRFGGLGVVPGLRRLSLRRALLTLVTGALAAAAVIGTSEGPASHRIASHAHATRLTSSADPGAFTDAAGEKSAASHRPHGVTRRHPASRARSHARTRARRTRVVRTQHRAALHHSAGSASPTVTEASVSSSPAHPSAPPVSTTPTASTASTVASTGSQPAAGPAGPTGFGEMSGGCSPKCK
jgi:hypothetical protein